MTLVAKFAQTPMADTKSGRLTKRRVDLLCQWQMIFFFRRMLHTGCGLLHSTRLHLGDYELRRWRSSGANDFRITCPAVLIDSIDPECLESRGTEKRKKRETLVQRSTRIKLFARAANATDFPPPVHHLWADIFFSRIMPQDPSETHNPSSCVSGAQGVTPGGRLPAALLSRMRANDGH